MTEPQSYFFLFVTLAFLLEKVAESLVRAENEIKTTDLTRINNGGGGKCEYFFSFETEKVCA